MQWLLLTAVLPYFIMLLGIWLRLRKVKRFYPSGTGTDRLTVVVPCRNESANIINLLNSLQSQDLDPSHFEIIFADDGSTDGTCHVIRSFAEEQSLLNIRILNAAGRGKKAAISTAVSAASNDLMVTTDADCTMGPQWLRTISEFSSRCSPDMIIGQVRLAGSSGFWSGIQKLEFLSLQGVTAGTVMGNSPAMCNGANLAFRKEAWLRNARNLRQDVPSGDDVFLLHSLKKEGARISWLGSPESMVTASAAGSPGAFLRQRKRWISKARFYRDLFTITLGIVTFVTILAQISTLLAGFFNPGFWLVCASVIIVKSIPDFLILHRTASGYGELHLMKWFIPAQLIYPFYVLAVIFYPSGNWKR